MVTTLQAGRGTGLNPHDSAISSRPRVAIAHGQLPREPFVRAPSAEATAFSWPLVGLMVGPHGVPGGHGAQDPSEARRKFWWPCVRAQVPHADMTSGQIFRFRTTCPVG
jgi:hypothetical protein